ncbi:MAG: hypothetical protein WBR24_23625, partial [Desulfobacterales bacterium]
MIEIKTVNIANGDGDNIDFNIPLPVNTYQLVSSTYGFETLSNEINLEIVPDPYPEDVDFN